MKIVKASQENAAAGKKDCACRNNFTQLCNKYNSHMTSDFLGSQVGQAASDFNKLAFELW